MAQVTKLEQLRDARDEAQANARSALIFGDRVEMRQAMRLAARCTVAIVALLYGAYIVS